MEEKHEDKVLHLDSKIQKVSTTTLSSPGSMDESLSPVESSIDPL